MIALLQPDLIDRQQELVPDRFLELLPQIRRQASIAFRHQRAEARQELIEEVIARAYCAWVRLVQLGKEAVAYATPLAQFAIRRVREGRQVGGGHSVNDVMSLVASRTRGFKVASLNQHDQSNRQLESTAGGRPPSRAGRNGGGPDRCGRLVPHVVEAAPPDRQGISTGRADRCGGQAIWSECRTR